MKIILYPLVALMFATLLITEYFGVTAFFESKEQKVKNNIKLEVVDRFVDKEDHVGEWQMKVKWTYPKGSILYQPADEGSFYVIQDDYDDRDSWEHVYSDDYYESDKEWLPVSKKHGEMTMKFDTKKQRDEMEKIMMDQFTWDPQLEYEYSVLEENRELEKYNKD